MASGDTLVAASFPCGFPPTSNPGEPGRTAANVPFVAFDDSTDESWLFSFMMPGHYDGSSSVKVILPWKFTTYVGSQTCDWEVSICRCDDDAQSLESLTFATAQTVLDTEAGASGEVSYAEVTFTNAQFDGVQGGDWFILKVERDASGGTASPGDAELGPGIAVEEA